MIYPLTGLESGGTLVEVHGANFRDLNTAYCKFAFTSGDVVVSARWVMSSRLECISPVGRATEYVPVEVTMNDQNYSDDNVQFEYQGAAHVENVLPSKGPIDGGTYVRVEGSGFAERSSLLSYLYCRFNSSTVPANFNSSTLLICVSPEH